MNNLNIIPLSEKYNLHKEKQLTIRLHEHGLLRLIPISATEELFLSTNKILFHALINSSVYKEMFFDHFSQKSEDKHGPFLLRTIDPDDFFKIDNTHLVQEVVQLVSSPKWSCPPISKEKLTDVKKMLNHVITKDTESFYLQKCLSFNSSSQEAIVYEHEWSHSLTSFYEYVLKDKENSKIYLLIITYE